MRAFLVSCAFLSCVPLALAAPGPSLPPPSPAEAANEAKRFASGLQLLLDQIAEGYVQPLPREELYAAALAGVCQAARKALPRGLSASLKKALAPDAPPGA